jgi:hypothetical protein
MAPRRRRVTTATFEGSRLPQLCLAHGVGASRDCRLRHRTVDPRAAQQADRSRVDRKSYPLNNSAGRAERRQAAPTATPWLSLRLKPGAYAQGGTPMSFIAEEIAYLRSQPLTRFATVGPTVNPTWSHSRSSSTRTGSGLAGSARRRRSDPCQVPQRRRRQRPGRPGIRRPDLDRSVDPHGACGSTAAPASPWNASRRWSAPACTCASPQPPRGAGTSKANPPAPRGTRRGEPSTKQPARTDRCPAGLSRSADGPFPDTPLVIKRGLMGG